MTTTLANPTHVISIAGRLLPKIFTTVRDIANKVEQVKINKRQCQTLIQRIQIVTSYLQKPELSKRIQSNNDPLHQTLENFQRFLEQCLTYISSFTDHSRIRKFLSSSSYKEEFNHLNNQLQMYYSELTFGINIKNLLDKKQDEVDQNEDLHELLTIIIEQQNSLLEYQAKRFDQLEQILAQNHVPLQLKYIQEEQSNDIFQNGIWSSRCFESGQWHGPFQHQIVFNSNNHTCDGHGKDHIGTFTLTGSFLEQTQQMNIILSYKSNSKLKMDKQYEFQLTWNKNQSLFEGLKYKPIGWAVFSDGSFEMSFVKPIKD